MPLPAEPLAQAVQVLREKERHYAFSETDRCPCCDVKDGHLRWCSREATRVVLESLEQAQKVEAAVVGLLTRDGGSGLKYLKDAGLFHGDTAERIDALLRASAEGKG